MGLFDSGIGRIAAGVATGGASELLQPGGGILGGLKQSIGLGSAPGAAPLPYLAQQQDLINRLQARANGTTPSLADYATNVNQGNALNNTMAQLNSSAGLNPALQARLAAQAGQQNQSDIAQQGTAARMQEQQQADQALGGQILGAQGQQQQVNQQASNDYNSQAQRTTGLLSGLGMAGATFATSDRNAKEDIKNSDGSARDFVDHLKGKLYEYKDAADGEGVHVGIMAQDLEKTPLGKPMVFEENGVKKVDFGKGFGALLGAVAEINDKLKELEAKKGK